MSIKPMYDNIVIKPIKADEKTAGGIYIANNTTLQAHEEGEVVAIGEGYRVNGELVPLRVNVGDTVLYRKGVEVATKDENGDDIVILSEGTVLAIR